MKLYHHPFSSNARKVVMTASMLGIDLELVFIDLAKGENRTPELLKLNPNGKVPILQDGDFVLWESHAIMQYLADKRPGNALYPTDLRVRADVNRCLFWDASHWSPAIATLVYENVIKKMMGAGEPDPAQVKRGETALEQFGKILDDHFVSRDYLVGKALTIADLAIAAPLMYAVPARLPVDKFTNIQRWFTKIQGLDAWQKTTPKT